MAYDFNKIINYFDLDGELISCERYGEGHINETYLAVMKNGDKTTDYILQKINNKIFKNVEGLMRNITLVTEYVRDKVKAAGGNPVR